MRSFVRLPIYTGSNSWADSAISELYMRTTFLNHLYIQDPLIFLGGGGGGPGGGVGFLNFEISAVKNFLRTLALARLASCLKKIK